MFGIEEWNEMSFSVKCNNTERRLVIFVFILKCEGM